MPTSIGLDRLREMLASGAAQLVEVLPAEDYAKAHLPGALNLPLRELDASTAAALDASRPVVVYCWDPL